MENEEDRVEQYLEVIVALAKRDFTRKAVVGFNGDAMDALGAGINMLGEELRDSSISLNEKEVLLKEIHHRVKNNLQIISSLLNLQSSFIRDEAASRKIRESQDRIKSMALIHEMIYQSEDLSSIEMGSYLRQLQAYLFRSYPVENELIECSVNLSPEKLYFKVDHAIPIGLILNELVTNSLKYAFTGANKNPQIDISLVMENENVFVLDVADNGQGFEGSTQLEDPETLGLSLVQSLVEQLDGTLSKPVTSQGTRFSIGFSHVN